jgi:hypothetical protein
MNILETIAARKRIEIEERRKAMPVDALMSSSLYSRQTISLTGTPAETRGVGHHC